MSLWGELKRRNVFKVGAAYAIVAWLIVQIATAVLPSFEAPRWVIQTIVFLLILGFPVALLLAWAYEVTPGGIKRTEQVRPAERITQVTGQRLNYIVIALLGVAVVFIGAQNYLRPTREAGGAAQLAASTPAGGGSGQSGAATAPAQPVGGEQAPAREVLPNSVAVLPFENLSPNKEDAYFAEGIHEEILNYLAKLKSLNVISRTSVVRYANTDESIQQIAKELNVQTVMEGSVRYAGDRVRVTTQLIDAATGAHLWSEAYERDFKDIFAIQADIAMKVANAVGARFSDEEQASIEQPATSSPAAYALYLRARSLMVETGNAATRAHALLDRALELDPRFASALGMKAGLYAQQLINTAGSTARDQAELEPQIRSFATRALALDPRSPEAHSALGMLAAFTWRWTEARESNLRALESRQVLLGPNWFVSWSGSHEESIRFARQAATLSPLDWQGPWNLGIVLDYAGRYDEAAASLRKGIEMAPAQPLLHSWLVYTEVARGDNDAARKEMQLTEQLLPEREIIYLLDLAYCYGRVGDRENARRLYDEIKTVAANQEIGAGGWALASMAIGDYDEGLRWLNIGADKAKRHEIDAGMFSLMNVKLNFTADPMLEQPQFVDVRNRLRGD